MFAEILTNTRKQKPLIHSITNYVTANDCANMIFACGGSPCMSDDPDEVADIVSICSGLTVNLGTLSPSRFEAMVIAGTAAVRLGKPLVFDPVGAGSSRSRTDHAKQFISLVKPTAIRGNLSEIKALSEVVVQQKSVISGLTRGVDSPLKDFKEAIIHGKALAGKTGAIIVVTGPTDIVTDGKTVRMVGNGNELLTKITGSGCMMSSVMTSFIASNPDNVYDAVTAASGAIGICGEIAKERMKEEDGNASFRNYLIDAMYNLDPWLLDARINLRMKEEKDEDTK